MNSASKVTSSYWAPFSTAEDFIELPEIVRGSGLRIYDDEDRAYLDGISGSYNHSLGHSHEGLIDAISQQLQTLVHACNMNSNTKLPQQLAGRLQEKFDCPELQHTLLVSSGSEGVEAAIKLAWFYQSNLGRENRKKIVSIRGAYHGCTLGAMIATQRDFITVGIPTVTDQYSIAMPLPKTADDVEAWASMLKKHEQDIAAVIVEPVMGMEGSYELPSGFLEKLSVVLQEHDILLIADEVYCGVGRTGFFCESESQNAQPDIVIFSKGLGGGFPIATVTAHEKIYASFERTEMPFFRHGHTQSGNLLGCTAALYLLEYLDQNDVYQQVQVKGKRLLRSLKLALSKQPSVKAIRGKGLMISVSFASMELCRQAQLLARRHGLVLGSASANLKVSPSLLISDNDINEIVSIIQRSVEELAPI